MNLYTERGAAVREFPLVTSAAAPTIEIDG
jgi:hypothetical protein